MISMGFEFDVCMMMIDENSAISVMECWLTINHEQVRTLPFVLTVEEYDSGVRGLLSLEKDSALSFVEIEAANEDEFFNVAHSLVENWLFDFTWNGKP